MSEREQWPHAQSIHLVISSLGSVILDTMNAKSVKAEDSTGNFGLRPGHADFLTVLTVGVLSWQDTSDAWHHCALRRGVMSMQSGFVLNVATREAVLSDDLDRLEQEALSKFTERQAAQEEARIESRQLEARALQALVRAIRPDQRQSWP